MKLVKRVFILGIVLTLGLVTFAQAEMSHLVDDHVLVNDIEQEVVPELPPCPILDEALAASQYDQRINGNTTESDGMYLEEQADVPDDVLDSLEEPWIEAQEDIELGLEEQATSPVPAASQQYYNNGGIIAPYLFARSDGYERVEWIKSYDSTTPKLIVERYDFNFKIKSQKNIALSQITPRGATASTTFLGGVFEGKNANFVVTGQPNTEQSVSKKVIRVTKFDKNWKYLANCQLSKDSFGANANYGAE
ncbi:MAG: hypothetical protein IJ125_09275, partial [Atopobiaceae bacterium]|nr:hypothetical protein [Atopobiaceae bacterium]